jgi:putative membrane protein
MRTNKGSRLLAAGLTVALAVVGATAAAAADPNTGSTGAPQRGAGGGTPGRETPSGTDNMRSGTDNMGATGAGTGRRAAPPPADQAPDQTTPADVSLTVASLHVVNQMEIEAGRLAQEKGLAAEVRDFGGKLVREHRAADDKLLAYAKKRGLDLNAEAAAVQAQPDHAKMRLAMDRLSSLQGAAFDRAFATEMADGHRKTIDKVTTARATATDPELKSLLGELLPALERHYRTAARLSDSAPRSSAATPDSPTPGHAGPRPVDQP